MVATTLVILRMIRLKEMEDCIILTEIIIRDNGKITELMDLDNIFQLPEESIRVIGKAIKGTDRENKFGLMELNSKEIINLTRDVEMVNTFIRMVTYILVNLRLVNVKEKE
jgi:hypothetical protein